MKIQSFGSRRDDHNSIKFLLDGEKPITLPKARQLRVALANLSRDTSRQNLIYLMSIANSNQYGLKENSALKSFLHKNSQIGNLPMENNDWNTQLQKAVRHSINSLPKNKREAFEKEYKKIFITQKELTPDERRILRYREYITNSKPIQNALLNKDTQNKLNTSIKYLDYFIASSETPIKDKVYILSKLAYMLSDKYKINHQLTDKKAQLFSEIINDLVVKTPESPILTTKDCSQEQHGSCAAISLARKALVYEDKRAYVDTILSEVNASPYMDIYDVTRLLEYQDDKKKYRYERAPKVKVDKAIIDYNTALKKGYRIIDTSVLHWMKIAGSIGDGTINLEDYIPFDKKHNDFMFDTRTINTIDTEYTKQHQILRALIKSNNLLEKYDESCLKKRINQQMLLHNGAYYANLKSNASNEIRAIIDEIAPYENITVKSEAIRGLLNLKNININNNNKELKRQISTYLTSKLGNNYALTLDKLAYKFIKPLKTFVENNDILTDLQNSRKTKYRDASLLFKIGVAQRAILEEYADYDNSIDYLYKKTGLPNRSIQINNELQRLKKLALQKPTSPYLIKFQKKNGVPSKDTFKTLDFLDDVLNNQIPKAIDDLLKPFGMSYKKILLDLISSEITELENGDYNFMYNVCSSIKMTPDVPKFKNKLNKIIEQLKNANSHKELSAIMAEIGCNNKNEYLLSYIKTISSKLENSIKNNENINFNKGTNKQVLTQSDTLNLVQKINKGLLSILNYEEVVAEKLNYPDKKTVILKKCEDLGYILKKEELDDLEKKLSLIDKFLDKRSNADNENDVYVGDIFKFTDNQKRYLTQIKNNIPEFKKMVKRGYLTTNKIFKDELDKIYEELGKRKGFFWIGEEGHSGLYDSESVRIIEQMTGRPYYIEKDIDVIAKSIKDGNGSGASSTMVSYDEYSGHAQYIADVKTIKYKDPKTGKIKTGDVILHDNTWGHREQKGSFIDKNGILRTDYGNNYGGKEGFVLDESGLEGEFVDNYKFDNGIDTSERSTRAIEGAMLEIDKDESYYPIMQGARIPGLDPRIGKKISKIFSYIFDIQNKGKEVENLFVALDKVKDKANVDILVKGDEIISKIQENLLKQIGGNGRKKLTIEEYNDLPVNNPLKIIINKLIIRKALDIPEDDEELENLKTQRGIDFFKEKYLKNIVNNWLDCSGKLLNKHATEICDDLEKEFSNVILKIQDKYNNGLFPFTYNIKAAIKDVIMENKGAAGDELVEKILTEIKQIAKNEKELRKVPSKELQEVFDTIEQELNELLYSGSIQSMQEGIKSKYLVHFIDKYYKPATDEELMKIYQDFVNTPKSELEKIFSKVTFEDIGIKFDSPENILKLIQAGNWLEIKRFEDESRLHYFYDIFPLKISKNRPEISKELADFNKKYRSIDVDVSNIGGEQYLKEAKDYVFKKYKARPAIPNVQIKSDMEIYETLQPKLDSISQLASILRGYKVKRKFLIALNKVNGIINNHTILTNKTDFLDSINMLQNLAEIISDMDKTKSSTGQMLKMIRIGNISYSKFKKLSENIKEDITEKLNGDGLDEVEQLIYHYEKTLHSLKNIVAINVLPKHQSKTSHLLNIWLTNLAKHPNSDETKNSYNELMTSMVKHHVLKEPGQLLSYAVKFAKQTPKNEKVDDYDEIKDGLKELLSEAYLKANKTILEYKLMKAARLGIGVKIKDYLRDNTVDLNDNSEVKELRDNDIEGIITSLSDAGTNQSTLMLFFEQAGLVDRLLKTLYKTDIPTIKRDFVHQAKNMVTQQSSQKKLNETCSSVYNKFPEDSKFTGKKQLEEIYKLLESSFKKVKIDRKNLQSIYDFYLETYKTIIDNSTNIDKWKNAKLHDVLNGIHSAIDGKVDEGLIELAKRYNDKVAELSTKIDLLANVRLLQDSQEDKKRIEFINLLNKTIEFATKIGSYVCPDKTEEKV